ncbi:DUF4386 domain-containing protein [Patescibacteria group bacterium]
MKSYRKNAITAGTFFLIAMITSIVGGSLLEPILTASDSLVQISENNTQVAVFAILELISAISVIGITAALFPIIKKYNEGLAAGYLGFRILESVACVIVAIIPLSLMTLSKEFVTSELSDVSHFQTLGITLLGIRNDAYNVLIPLFFSLGAYILYYTLYKTKFVPRFLSIWGLISVAFIVILNILTLDMSIGIFLALPMILNEIVLGIWLIVKGFDKSKLT